MHNATPSDDVLIELVARPRMRVNFRFTSCGHQFPGFNDATTEALRASGADHALGAGQGRTCNKPVGHDGDHYNWGYEKWPEQVSYH